LGKDRDRRNIFSTYVDLQDILLYNLQPLVHIVGFKQVHTQIQQLTLESALVKE